MANEFKVKKGLLVEGSGTVVDVQGTTNGQLFSITDSLTGILLSVNDISGIPILEVSSDDRVKMGTFGSEGLIVEGSSVYVNADNGVGDFLTRDTNGIIKLRTVSEVLTDIGITGGSGANGRVTFWTGTDTLSSDGLFNWDNTEKRLGVGTTIPSTRLHVVRGITNSEIARFSGSVLARGLTISTYLSDGTNDGGVQLDSFDSLAFSTRGVDKWSIRLSGVLQSVGAQTIQTSGTETLTLQGNGGAIILGTQATSTTHAVRADRSITAGNGLTGGGDLSDNRTITLGTPSTLTVSTTNGVTTSSHTHVLDLSGRTLTAGDGLTGGGDLSTNRTFDVDDTVSRRQFVGDVDTTTPWRTYILICRLDSTVGSRKFSGRIFGARRSGNSSAATIFLTVSDTTTTTNVSYSMKSDTIQGPNIRMVSCTTSAQNWMALEINTSEFNVFDSTQIWADWDYLGAGISLSTVNESLVTNVANYSSFHVVNHKFYGGVTVDGTITNNASNGTGDIVTVDGSNILRRRTTAQILTDIGAEPSFVKGNVVQGTGVTLSGTLTGRLVGTGDITITNSAPHIATNLSIGSNTTTVLRVDSSTGNNVTLPLATTLLAGVMSAADKIKLDASTSNTGTVTSVSAGNGLNFTTITTTGAVTLGTPSQITVNTTSSVTSTSHTHLLNLATTRRSIDGTGGSGADLETGIHYNVVDDGLTSNFPSALGTALNVRGNTARMFQLFGNTSSNFWLRSLHSSGANVWRKIWLDADFSSTDVTNWNTAFGWGNHASVGYSLPYRYTAVVRKGSWSRIATTNVVALGGSYILALNHTRTSVVVNAVFLITSNHSNSGTIVQLSSGNYTQVQVRLTDNGVNDRFIEVFEDGGSEAGDYNYTVNLTPLGSGNATPYTVYTAGGGTVRDSIQSIAGGFAGDGKGLISLNASNLLSGTIPSARLTGTYGISITGNASTVTNGVYTSRNINTGLHLSGGGDLSIDRTITFTPQVQNWMVDSQSQNRMFFGDSTNTTSQTVIRASNDSGEFQLRNVATSTTFAVNFGTGTLTTGTVPWARLSNHTSINTGLHLSGGGNLSADRTLSVVFTANSYVTDNESNSRLYFGNAANTTNQTIIRASNDSGTFQLRNVGNGITFAVNFGTGTLTTGIVPWARLSGYPTITAGTGLSGGGDLSANRTLNVTYGTTAGTSAQGNDVRITNGQIGFDSLYKGGYSFPNGFLVATDIATSSNTMFLLKILGNGYGGGIFDISVQGYNHNNGDNTLNVVATSTGTITPLIKVFNYDGFLHFWMGQTGSFQSPQFRVWNTSGGNKFNRVTSVTNEEFPATGVTRLVDVTPIQLTSGTGVAGQVAVWNGASTQLGYNGFTFDAATSKIQLGNVGATFRANSAALIIGSDATSDNRILIRPDGDTSSVNQVDIRKGIMAFTGAQTINTTSGVLSIQPSGGIGTGVNITNNLNIYSSGGTSVLRNIVTSGSIIIAGGDTTGNGGNMVLGGSTGTNDIRFRIGGTEYMSLQSNGNVFIGSTTPLADGGKLQVSGTVNIQHNAYPLLQLNRNGTTSAAMSFTGNDSVTTYIGSTAGVFGVTGAVQAFNVAPFRVGASTGNVFMNDINAGGKLTLADHTTNAGGIRFRAAATAVDLWSSASNALNTSAIFSAGSYRVGPTTVIDSSRTIALGNGSVGTPALRFSGDTNTGMYWVTTDTLGFSTTGVLRLQISPAGAMGLGVTPTNTTGRFEASNDIVAYSSSDIRFKSNVKVIDNAMEKLSLLNGTTFDWIEMEEYHGNKGFDYGVIAQEVEKIFPEMVKTRDSGYKAVRYEKLIPVLIQAVKELNDRLTKLESKIG